MLRCARMAAVGGKGRAYSTVGRSRQMVQACRCAAAHSTAYKPEGHAVEGTGGEEPQAALHALLRAEPQVTSKQETLAELNRRRRGRRGKAGAQQAGRKQRLNQPMQWHAPWRAARMCAATRQTICCQRGMLA